MQISYTFHVSSKKSAITTTRKLSSAAKHNLRKYSSGNNQTGHYDSGKIVQLAGSDNLYQDVENVYHEQFDQAVSDYNKKQKRSGRKITDYMRYVSENGKSDVAVEVIIQLGDREFWEQVPEQLKYKMTYIFKDQLNALRQYIPEFVIANAVIHYDEDSPHMQVIGVPVSSGYNRGLYKQCSKTRVFTRASLEKLQNVLRERARAGMEKNPEIFQNTSLKAKEAGRNFDYTKEFYIQRKKEKLEEIDRELSDKRQVLSETEEKTENAKTQLGYITTELTRKEQESFALVPFHKNDVFPVDGKMRKVLRIDDERRTVDMCDDSSDIIFPPEKTYPLALVRKSFFEYIYSDIGLRQMREYMDAAEDLRLQQEQKREALAKERRDLEAEKKELSTLKKDVENLSHMECPFHLGDQFEVNGEMATVSLIREYSGVVSFWTKSRQLKELPLLDAIRAYNAFHKKQELSEECCLLEQQITDLKADYEKSRQALSEINTIRNVFRHFPEVKDFVLEIGRKLKFSVHYPSLEDIKEAFREKVLGITNQRPEHERPRGRSR